MFYIKQSIILFFTFCPFVFVAQPGFNKLVDSGHPRGDIHDMLIVNDTIIGYGVGFDDTINYQQALILTKMDSNGVLLKSMSIVDTLGDRLAIDKTWGKIIPTGDGGFAMTAATVFRKSAFLIKTDRDFNVEFIREYPDTVNLSNFEYKLIEINDGYLLFGMIQRPNFLLRTFVRRVDKNGNTVWFKFYGSENTTDTFIDAGQINDTLFVFAGISGTTVEQTRSLLQIIDIDGNVKQTWLSPTEPDMGLFRSMRLLQDGSILAFGQKILDIPNQIVQPVLSKYNSNLSVEWVREYGRIEKAIAQIRFWDIEPLPPHDFIGAGQSRTEVSGELRQSGWLMKFSTEGDSIWSRYDFPDFPVDSLGDTFFGGVGVLSSGSIVAGGTATLWNEQAIWLVKVTPDGCMEVINCGLVPVGEVPGKTEQLIVYPNPADGAVHVRLGSPATAGTEVGLYDARGRMVGGSAVQSGADEVVLDIAGLSPGLYFVRVSSPGEVHLVGKVIIKR